LEPSAQPATVYSEVTAIHEAAHGVTALVLGYGVEIVQICECGRGFCRHAKANSPDDIVIGLAGAVAVIKKFGESKATVSDGDMTGFMKATETERKQAIRRAAEIVSEPTNWELIEKLARLLETSGTFNAESLPPVSKSVAPATSGVSS
jgi:hypothetical protein